MTKVTVFGQEEGKGKEKKPIEFVHYLNDLGLHNTTHKPSLYTDVCLLGEAAFSSLDLIMAWNNQGDKFLYIGHWNDGVVD